MGMFDYISDVGPQSCQHCGAPLDNWQSKDGECFMDSIPYWRVTRFYTYCNECLTWHEFVERVTQPPPFRPLSDYQLMIRSRGEDELRPAPHVGVSRDE